MSCEGWEALILENVCDISSSKRIYAREYQDSGVPFYRGKEIIEKFKGNKISTKLFVSEKKFIDLEKKFGAPKQGDILLSSVGTLGVPYLVQNEKFYFKDGNLTWFKNFETNCDSRFVYWWLQSPAGQNQINNKAIGSTQKALTIDTLKKFDIQVPPLAEQKAIAATLSCLDDKIELNNQMNDTLEQMAQALFKSWFVDFEPFQDGEFEDSELGKIPKGWKVGTINNYCAEMKNGGTPNRKKKEYWQKAEVPWIKTGEIKNNLLIASEEFISQVGLENSSAKILPTNAVIMAMYGATAGEIGLLRFEASTNQACCAMICDTVEKSLYLYLCLLWRQAYIKGLAVGAAQQNLSKDTISKVKILIPDEQTLSMKIFNEIFFKVESNLYENKKLSSLRDALLPKLMSGKIRVPVESAE